MEEKKTFMSAMLLLWCSLVPVLFVAFISSTECDANRFAILVY